MKIVKFCNNKHHILKSEKVLIGNFEYYRNHENVNIKDSAEASVSHQLENENGTLVELEPGQAEKFFGSRIKLVDKVKAKHFIKKETFPNSYIFCASILQEFSPDWGKQFGEEYDSFYEIINPDGFAQKLGGLLINNLIENGKNVGSFYYQHQQVEYKNDHTTILNHLEQSDLEKMELNVARSVFVKRNEFEKNKEYRFLWIIFDADGVIMQADKRPILLPSAPLRTFINPISK